MRVLYVLHQFFPKYHSGTEQFVLALARAGRARGDDVRVLALDPDFRDRAPVGVRELSWEGVPTTIVSFDKDMANWTLRDYDAPDLAEPFARVLDAFEPEVVHVFHLRFFGVDRLLDLRARGQPFVVHVMDFWFVCPNFLLLHRDGHNCDGPPDQGFGCVACMTPELMERFERDGQVAAVRARAHEVPQHRGGDEELARGTTYRLTALRRGLALAAKVYAPSRIVAERLVANGHELGSVVHLPYGVDRSRFQAARARQAAAPSIGFLGTFAPHKGVDVLIEGFRQLEDEDLVLSLHGRFGDDPVFDQRLQGLASGDARIRFAGPFGREELGQVLEGLDIVVVPSRWRENTPFVCLEARIAGLRLLVADLPGMTEAVSVGRGRSFRAGDPQSLARELRILVDEVRSHGPRLEPDESIASIEDQYEFLRRDYVQIVG